MHQVNLKKISKKLFIVAFIFFTLLNFSTTAYGATPPRILIIIDSSASISEKGLKNIRLLLGQGKENDELARQITVITYPTATGIKVSNFRNSAEFSFYLQSLSLVKGTTDLNQVITIGRSWASEYATSERLVYWISDGGGIRTLGLNSTEILEKMSGVSSTQNWTIAEIGASRNLESLSNEVSNYFEVPAKSTASQLQFPKIDVVVNNPINDESAKPETLKETTYVIGILAIVASVAFLFLLNTLFKLANRRGLKSDRESLFAIQFPQSGPKSSSTNGILKKIPALFKGPINEIGDRYQIDENKQFRLIAILFMFTFVFCIFIIKNIFVSLLLTLFVPGLLIRIFNNRMKTKDEKIFSKELPGFLSLLSSGLKSGLSFQQNVDAYCQMTDGILARDFRRVLSESNMGSSLDESLETLATERKNDDLTWLVTAILIQKNVGGSLSTIIDTVLETINARGEVRREIRALSAEGKLSAYVLIALPIFIFLFLTFTRRSYVEVLWKESLGQLILVVIGTLISIGWLWMRKVVNIKV
jgi:Flp pilus assembly protein TadB